MSNVTRELQEAVEAAVRVYAETYASGSLENSNTAWTAFQRTLRAFIEAAPEKGGEPKLPLWWDAFILNICELPDRNSPDDEPEAMVATADELEGCALRAMVRYAHPAAAKEPGVKWRDIMQMRLSDDLMWFAKGDSIEGPRRPEHDDYDRWQWFCLAEPPPMPESK